MSGAGIARTLFLLGAVVLLMVSAFVTGTVHHVTFVASLALLAVTLGIDLGRHLND